MSGVDRVRRSQSKHVLVKDAFERYFIVSCLVKRNDTQVISIEGVTGRLHYTSTPGVDLFSTYDEAMRSINGADILCEAAALIGYMVIGSEGLLLVATSVTETFKLPPNHSIVTISDSMWVRIPLTYPFGNLSKSESAHLNTLLALQMKEGYYYSDTYDVTHLYPNSNPVSQYNKEFVWNHALRSEFIAAGIEDWCCVLLQGMAISLRTADRDLMNECTIGLLTRRSSLNPSIRSQGNGLLNEYHSPPNEHELELLVYTVKDRPYSDPTSSATKWVKEARWASHVARTGTVPVEATTTTQPNKGCQEYWKRLLKRYGGGAPVVCVSLLAERDNAVRSYYEQSLAEVKKIFNIRAEFFHYDLILSSDDDWQASNGKSFDAAAENMWKLVVPSLVKHGVSSGVQEFSKTHGHPLNSSASSRQEGVFRFSCIDGTEKSSTAYFVAALQVVPELCRMIGVNHCNGAGSTPKADWPLRDMKLSEVKGTMSRAMISNIVVLFAEHSDLVTAMYIGQTQSPTGLASLLPKVFGDVYSVVRKKVFSQDKLVPQQLELLLQQKRERYFPSLGPCEQLPDPNIYETRLLSEYPSAILATPVPCAFRTSVPQEVVLLADNACNYEPWVVPAGVDHATLSIVLPEFCTVTEVHITIRHTGVDTELLTPAACDILVGHHADSCVPAYTGLRLPIAADGTCLRYTIPSHLSGMKSAGGTLTGRLNNYHSKAAPSYMRVVHLTFQSLCPTLPMLLGNVQVFGIHGRQVPCDPLSNALDDMYVLLNDVKTTRDIADGKLMMLLKSVDDIDDLVPDSDSDFSDEGEVVLEPAVAHVADSEVQDMSAAVDEYTELVKEKVKRKVDFTEALVLEYKRLELMLPSIIRDVVLYQLGQSPDAFDPSRLVFKKDRAVEASMRKRLQTSLCSDQACQKSFRFMMRSKASCKYCRMTYCKECMYKDKTTVIEYGWDASDNEVCTSCAAVVRQQKELIQKVRNVTDERGLQEMYAKIYGWLFRDCLQTKAIKDDANYEVLMSRPYSVAELPSAAILSTVPTHIQSPPVESILYHPMKARYAAGNVHANPNAVPPLEQLHSGSYWFTPDGCEEVVIDISIPIVVHATSVILMADCLGYCKEDMLKVTVEVGLFVGQLYPCGEWDVGEVPPGGSKEFSLGNYPPDQGSQIVRLRVELANGIDTSAPIMRQRIHIGYILVQGLPKLEAPVENEEEPVTETRSRSGAVASGVKSKSKLSYIEKGSRQTLVSVLTNPNLEKVQRETVKKECEDWMSKENTLEIVLRSTEMSTTIMGFSIDHKNDDTSTHARDIRISIFRGTEESQSHINVGDFVIPAVGTGCQLHFLFPVQYQLSSVKRVRCEILSFYGASRASKPTISLFTSSIRVNMPKAFPSGHCSRFVAKSTSHYNETAKKASHCHTSA
eukprot:TRINITY_DN60_c0_g4_i1.p1 TRINITY_DN60_c0_g4~~TRINITY_DN60_c0_g4_i1.p1  ORF type:complete len:1424 (+),score=350.62 TRINITY_DN60_c0_g4_i1:35-4273(+)